MRGRHRERPVMVRCIAMAMVALVLCACGVDDPPSSPATGSGADGGRDVQRLRDALSAQDPDLVEILDDEATTVKRLDSPFPRWRVLTVDSTTGDHPLQWTFMVSRSGTPRAINLAVDAKRWSQLLEGLRVETSGEAAVLAKAYVDLTHDAAEGVHRVQRPDDIRWLTSTGKAAAQRVAADRATVTPLVHGPQATATGQGWRVTLTAMHQAALTEHVLEVTRGGDVTESTRTVADDLAVRVAN